jgi:hypothetical protein
MIKIYPNVLTPETVENHSIMSPWILLEWLYNNGISRDRDLYEDPLEMALFVNNEPIHTPAWQHTKILPTDDVEIYRVPKGSDPFSITFALIFGAKAALKALMPKIPSQNTPNNRSGKGLDEANSKGNKIKLNSIRSQSFGLNVARYPDLATAGRRYFAGPREQRVEMLMFVGEGRYQIPVSRIKTGETPLNTLGDDARWAIYEPGQSLASDPAHYNWYPAPEVGASSTGSPGLELTVSSTLTTSVTASVLNFTAKTVVIPAGSGSFPADWGPNLLVRIASPYPYTINDGTGTGGRDVINGDIAQLGIPTGAIIEIAGTNAGTYTVFSQTATTMQLNYLGGAAATGLTVGSVTMVIGYPGLRYKVVSRTAQVLTVDRLLENGSVDAAWAGWADRSTNQGQIRLDSSNYTGGYRGAFPACPSGELVDQIQWSVLFTTLLGIGREGQEYPANSSHQFEYRDMAIGGAWTVITKTMTANSLDAVGFTFTQTLPYPMRPECRIKRLPVTGYERPEEIKDDSQWYSLYGRLYGKSPTTYAGMTMFTCDIRGGDRLSTTAENLISMETVRILPVLRNGAWQAEQPTREISAAVGQICRDAGYSDTEDLDIVELEHLETTRWTPRGEYYDKILMEQDTVKGYLLQALTAGFSELTIDRGVLVPVCDQARGEEFDHVYNPRVMLKPLKRSFVGAGLPDQFDGVDVEYFDAITKQNETVKCRLRLPGGAWSPGVKVKKEKLEGVTDRTRAWRYGQRVLLAYYYRQDTFEFETELAGLNSSYWSYAGLGDSTPNRGQNAEVTSYSKNPTTGVVKLGVSVKLDWSAPGPYKVLIRRRDGTASGPYTPTRVTDKFFTIPELDFVPEFQTAMMAPIIQFGPADRWIYPTLITEVKPKGTKTCSLKAVNYDVRVYSEDDNFPPPEA